MYQSIILAYVVISVGLILATVTFIVEVMHGQKKQRKIFTLFRPGWIMGWTKGWRSPPFAAKAN